MFPIRRATVWKRPQALDPRRVAPATRIADRSTSPLAERLPD